MPHINFNNFRVKDVLKLSFSFRRAIQFVWNGGPHWMLLNLGILLIQGVLPVLSIYMLKLIIDNVTHALAVPAAERSFEPVARVILLAGGVALLTEIVSKIGELVTKLQGWSVFDYMTDILQGKGIEVDLEYFENSQYQDTLHRAQQEAGYRPLSILHALIQITQSAVSLVGIGFLLFSFHWTIVPILLIAVMPGVLISMVNSNMQYWLERKYTASERKSWYYYWIIASTDFAKEVRIFGLGATIRNRYQDVRREIREARTGVEVKSSALSIIAQAISTASIFALYAFIAYRTLQGNNTLGDLVMYFQAFQRGQGFLQGALGGVARLYENNLFLSNLYEFLNIEPKIAKPKDPRPLPRPLRAGIAFEHVFFAYPNSGREVLHDISMKVSPGEVIALVGENGSGKTTLVKLLCRLYDPTRGCIKIDGTDIRHYDIGDLRREIGIIFQDYARYNLTALDNIWFGNVHQPPNLDQIVDAARQADAHNVITGLPQGYHTVLGKLFENGEELSIGQWQKIALARAFFRESQVIILDEPTSALDPKAEYELFTKFRELLNDRTAILISHRMSTVRMADRIYVIRDGNIAESGTHDELIFHAGIYAHFFEQQAQNYR